MTDPREHKLPKWAQELLEQERIKVALKFPDAPSPEPDFNIDGSGYGVGTPSLREAAQLNVYSFASYQGAMPIIHEHFVDNNGFLYRNIDRTGTGSRGHGNYWLQKGDAILAAKWAVCLRAAQNLVNLDALE